MKEWKIDKTFSDHKREQKLAQIDSNSDHDGSEVAIELMGHISICCELRGGISNLLIDFGNQFVNRFYESNGKLETFK